MTIRNLADYTFTSKYPAYREDLGRREDWKECVTRSRDMMLEKYKTTPEIVPHIIRAYDDVLEQKVLPSMRSLQFGGNGVFKHNARMYNCVSSHCDRPEFFSECFYLLLCGCGTGYSVQKHHVDNLPAPILNLETYEWTVADSIEGWADAALVLIQSYFSGTLQPVFDYSRIRPEGAPLSNGGKAPGHKPLAKALRFTRRVLAKAASEGRSLRPIDCYDIVCHLADAVISGGVRRSATICVFSPDDEEMVKAKTGNWTATNPQRSRSNNSAMLVRGEVSREQFAEIMKSVREYGEPGFLWSNSSEMIVNPCVEIGMYPVDQQTGKTGWQGCNLSTINGAKIKDEYDLYSAAHSAAVIGTLQAGFTDFPYLGKHTERIFKQEALIGVSMTGIMENPKVMLKPQVQVRAAEVVKQANKDIAGVIGINVAARTTCVKPEGTASCVLGTCSGIHPHHYKRYIRRVQSNKLDPVYQFYKAHNPESCDPGYWSENKTDDVVLFAIESKPGAITKRKVSAIELLEYVLNTQKHWVETGTRPEKCVLKGTTHNVSNTINVEPDEWEAVEQFIFDNQDSLCGVSLLSATGDKDYPQAPFSAVYLPSQMIKHYGADPVLKGGVLLAEINDETELWDLCKDVLYNFNKDLEFHAQVGDFACKYGLSLKETTYLLKDLWTYDRYNAIKELSVDVDYRELIETEDNTTQQQEIACAGGACEI